MPTVERAARIILDNGTGTRTLIATADKLDYAPGELITISHVHSIAGAVPPGVPQAVVIRIATTDGTVIGQLGINANPHTADYQFYMTHDGTISGDPRSGTIEIKIQATRTTIPTYDVETDGNPNSGGITSLLDRGWIRANTTCDLTPSSTDGAYPDVISLTADLGVRSFINRVITLAIGPDSGASNSTTDNHTRNITVDNTFPAAETIYTPTAVAVNDSLSGQPWALLTVTTQDVTVDPRLTTQWFFQKNKASFAVANDEADHTMLSSDVGQSAARILNANGVAQNGLTVTLNADPRNPGSTNVVNTSTATRDGQAGWTELIDICETGKPGGIWDVSADVTAPADISGDTYLLNSTDEVTVLAPNPSYGVICGAGPTPVATEGNHWTPGNALLIGVSLFDQQQATLIVADVSPSPVALLGRFRQDLGIVEYLDVNYDWQTLTGLPAYEIPLVQSPADSRVWVHEIPGAETSAWTEPTIDLFVVGVAYSGGTPYWNFSPVPVLNSANSHAKYAFDPIGLFK